VTEESLRRSGLYYLQRYAASTRSLRLVLERRVARSAAEHDIDMPAAALWIDSIIERFTRGGLLDDNGFAESRARSLFERGASARMIRAKLAEKGIARAAVDQALETVFADHEAPDITAANRFAQRRRLGPYRLTGARDANRTRDLAALARAGFGFDVARTVIDADSADALEAGGWAAQG
jgi:regulatory protein